MEWNTVIYDFRNQDPYITINNAVRLNDTQKAFIYAYTELSFINNYFKLVVNQYTLFHKIARYVQRNYVRFPIYEQAISFKQKNFINLYRNVPDVALFCERELKELDLTPHLKIKICDLLNYKPSWYDLAKQQDDLLQEYNKYKKIPARVYAPAIANLKRINYITEPSSKLHKFFYYLFFKAKWVGYVSPHQAEQNKIINKENEKYNSQVIIKTNEDNKKMKAEIDAFNEHRSNILNNSKSNFYKLQLEINKINAFNTQTIIEDNEEWKSLKEALLTYHNELNNVKGVYVIWNKTKNKYYVGQSKNMGKRIFSQHFSFLKNDVRNIIFAKDWYNNDEFYYQTIIYGDKHTNLDELEKETIAKYDAFKNGYNSTAGNE